VSDSFATQCGDGTTLKSNDNALERSLKLIVLKSFYAIARPFAAVVTRFAVDVTVVTFLKKKFKKV